MANLSFIHGDEPLKEPANAPIEILNLKTPKEPPSLLMPLVLLTGAILAYTSLT
jgi:hypothetical protein